MLYFVKNPQAVSKEAQLSEVEQNETGIDPVAALAKKRRKIKIALISLGAFLVLLGTILMVVGYFAPFYIDGTIKAGTYYGFTVAQDVTYAGEIKLTYFPIDLFTFAKLKDPFMTVAPGFAPLFTGVDLAIAGFAFFIVAIPVIIAAAFVKGQLTAVQAQPVSAA